MRWSARVDVMRALLIGDVGGVDGYHAGDEAMLDVAIAQLRARGPTAITVVSGNPDDTSARYGVDAVARVGFAGRDVYSDETRDQQLAAVLAIADGSDDAMFDTTDPRTVAARTLVHTVAASDAVLVAGGGNLSSSWPDQLYERVAVLLLAQRFGVPAVVSGQTIGPDLLPGHAAVLARALAGASLVGLRERTSYDLAAGFLPDVTRRSLQLDDAAFLPDELPEWIRADGAFGDGFVVLTVNPLGTGPEAEARLDGMTDLVRSVHALTGLEIVFLPHVGEQEAPPASGDLEVGLALRERLGDGPGLVIAPVLPARQLAWVTRRSSAVITTRYHGAVFGLTAAVPCLALYQDRYTGVKLRGALDHAGLGAWRLPLDALRSTLATEAFAELWTRRAEISSHLRSVTASWAEWDRAHWDDVWEALHSAEGAPDGRHQASSRAPAAATSGTTFVTPLEPKLDGWASATVVADAAMARTAERELQLSAALFHAERQERLLQAADAARQADQDEIARLQGEARSFELRRSDAEAETIQSRDDAMLAELSAEAARSMNTELLRRLAMTDADHVAHIDEIYATKTMRWTARPRHFYGRLRRMFGRH